MAFGFDAINVIRSNRSLLKRGKFKDVKNIMIETSGKTELELKQVSTKELAVIKTKIRAEAKRVAQKEIAIYGGCAIVLIFVAAYLFLQIMKMKF